MYKCEAVSSKENTIKYYTHIECTPTYKSMGVVLSTWSEITIDNVYFFYPCLYVRLFLLKTNPKYKQRDVPVLVCFVVCMVRVLILT